MIFSAAEDSILTNVAWQQFLIQNCDVRELLIISSRLAGRTYPEIAEEHSCSKRYVVKLMRRLKMKFLLFFRSS